MCSSPLSPSLSHHLRRFRRIHCACCNHFRAFFLFFLLFSLTECPSSSQSPRNVPPGASRSRTATATRTSGASFRLPFRSLPTSFSALGLLLFVPALPSSPPLDSTDDVDDAHPLCKPSSVPLVHPRTASALLDPSSLPTEVPPDLPTPEEIVGDPQQKRIEEKNEVKVVVLSNGLVVKRGKGLAIELTAIDWMSKDMMSEDGEMVTPGPQYRGFYRSDGVDYLFLSHVPGRTLESLWPSLNPPTRSSILTQLASILRILQSCTLPYIGRLSDTQSYQLPWRPSSVYRTREEYLGALKVSAPVDSSRWERGGDLSSRLDPLLLDKDSEEQPLGVLTHGDISARNILVDPALPDGEKIVGIIDWECLEALLAEMEYLRCRRELEKGWSKEEGAAREILRAVEEVSAVEEGSLVKSWEWYGEMVM